LRAKPGDRPLGVSGTFFAADGGERMKVGVFLPTELKSFAVVTGASRGGTGKIAVAPEPLAWTTPLGNALAIEVSHFFEEQDLQRRRAARAHGQRILVVANRRPASVSYFLFSSAIKSS